MSGDKQQAQREPSAAPARRARRVMLALGGIAVLGGLVWLGHWWFEGRFIESTNDAYLRADSMTVAPHVSGYVTQVLVADNQTVHTGEPLVRLDERSYAASLQQAEATLAARRADLARVQAEIDGREASVEQAQAQRQASAVRERHSADQVGRYAPLVQSGAETAERLADLRANRAEAAADVAAGSAAVKAAQRQVAISHAELAQARAQVDAAQASLNDARLNVGFTLIRSTIDGRVGDRTVRVGQYVQPGTRLLTVVPQQDVYLVANFKETQVGAMRPGQSASLRIDALPDTTLHGVVQSFAPGTGSEFALLPPENATGNFTKVVQRVPVRIRIDADAAVRERLIPGLSVTVDVDTRGPGGSAAARHAASAAAQDARHG